jgi:hypothetical protein
MRRLILLLLVALPLCAQDLVVPGTGIRLAHPEGWLSKPPTPATWYRWRDPDSKAGIAVSVIPVVAGTGTADVGATTLDDLRRLADDLDLVSWDFNARLGGRTWSRIRFRHHWAGTDWEQELWTLVEGDRQVTVALGAPPARFPIALPALEAMLAPSAATAPRLVP